MKGQYVAVEGVLTFGMGIIVAIGTISLFTTYQDSVLDSATERQVQTVESQISSTLFSLENVDTAEQEIDLPEEIGGSSYEIVLQDNTVRIAVGSEVYERNLNYLEDKEFEGSVDGGKVRILKTGEQFILGSA